MIFPLFVAITVFFVLPEKLLWIKEKWFVLKKTSSIGHKNAWCAIWEIFMFLQGCFCVPRTCLIWDFVCLCIAWIIEPVLIVWGLFGVAILIPGRFIFSLGVENTYQLPCWGHWSLLSSVLNRSGASVIVVEWTILSTNGVSMLFSHKFFGLPNVSPPPFCTLHWWYPSFWTCLFFSQKFNILYSCGAL